MNIYTVEEKVQIVKWVYTGNSHRETCRRFATTYPNRPRPAHTTVGRIISRFENTGTVCSRFIAPDIINPAVHDREIDIMAAVRANPNISVRQLSAENGLSKSYVHKILKKHKFKSYKYQPHQELREGDSENRSAFCQIMMDKSNNEPDFLERVCFTDECTFTLNNQPHSQNFRYWSTDNPHLIVKTHTQYPQKVNVWCGILNNVVIGPYFINGTLTGETYLELLTETICPAIEHTMLGDERPIWYQHDGCPAHNSAGVKEFLNNTFHETWIGRGGAIGWPARSPDLAPNDFFLWPYLKSKVYSSRVHPNLDSLKDKITEVCFNISPRLLDNIRRNFYDRLGYCMAVNGNLFEHLI